MIIECASQERVYLRFFGLVAQRLCQLDHGHLRTVFQELFAKWYSTIHRLETNKLRNVAKLFAHLLFTDSIDWVVLAGVRLTEEDTTSRHVGCFASLSLSLTLCSLQLPHFPQDIVSGTVRVHVLGQAACPR